MGMCCLKYLEELELNFNVLIASIALFLTQTALNPLCNSSGHSSHCGEVPG